MPRKKTAAKTTKKATKTVGRPRKTRTTTVEAPRERSGFERFAEYFKLGESYTSLVLGIIAVIIGTVLLLSIIHTRQSEIATPEVTPTIAQSQTFAISPTGVTIKQPEATSMPSPAVTATPAPEVHEIQPAQGRTYTVAAGENLWMISEKVYGSGYNWGDIASANNLANPSDIHAGDKLMLPRVKKVDEPTVHTADDNMSTSVQQKIVADSYTVTAGDSLWGIALRAYGDGYQWVKIAKANNLTDPNIIHKDNVLKIPRG